MESSGKVSHEFQAQINGKFSFITAKNGKFEICFRSANIKKKIKFSLKILTGEPNVDFERLAKNKEMLEIMKNAKILKGNVEYFLEKQAIFHQKNEKLFRINVKNNLIKS